MPTQTSINNLIMFAVRDRLIQKLITDLEDNPQPEDEAQGGLVAVGKLYDDPTKTGINLLVRSGGEDWEDTLNVADQTTAQNEYAYEIGSPYGGAFFKRRFVVEHRLFMPQKDSQGVAISQEESVLRGNVVKARLENAIWTLNVGTLGTDSFGESGHKIEVNDSWNRESGGPGSYIVRGETRFTVFTSIDIQDVTA